MAGVPFGSGSVCELGEAMGFLWFMFSGKET